VISGSSNGHSPVLNLSKTAGSGSVGEQSGSEAGASHRSQDDDEEDDNLSEDLEDDNEKDEGTISRFAYDRSGPHRRRYLHPRRKRLPRERKREREMTRLAVN